MLQDHNDPNRPARRSFHRDRANGKVFGVCAGLADYFGWDVKMTRIGWAVASLVIHPLVLVYLGIAVIAD